MTRTAWNKRTKKEIKEIVESLGYTYIDDYFGSSPYRKVIIQDKVGYRYDVLMSHVSRGRGIGFVDKGNPFSLENITLWLKINNSQFKLLDENDYKGNIAKLNLYCSNCKDYPKMTWIDILNGNGCGICAGQQTGERHNLVAQRPDIAKEWHPTLNGDLTPYDVTYGSNKKVWWICPNGHEYFSPIKSRSKSHGCRVCYDEYKESIVATELKKYIFKLYKSQDEYKIFKNPETNHYLSYDIYIFGGKYKNINGVYIEIHGLQHYKLNGFNYLQARRNGTLPEEEFEYQKHLDKIKRKFARKHGTYIEIDLRKIKNTEQAIEYVESILKTLL